MRRRQKETPALHPAREPSSPRAGDKKRVWNVRAEGDRQRYPTPGVGIARRHRVTSFIKLPEQTRADRLRRKGDAQAQAVKVRPAKGPGNRPLTKGEWKCHT